MLRVVALAFLATAGAAISLSEPALAKGMRGGGAPGFGGGVHMPRFHARPSPRAFGTIAPSVPFGTVKLFAPYGTVKPSMPYGTVNGLTPYGTVKPAVPYGTIAPATPYGKVAAVHAPKPKFARRHHGAYHTGWSFPVTYAGDAPIYIGIPYDPSEAIPVYGPAITEVDGVPAPQLSSARPQNTDPCASERVTVPAREGEREITVIRCSQ
jgi:hypothetical protein